MRLRYLLYSLEILFSIFIVLTCSSIYISSWKSFDSIASHATYVFLIISLIPGILERFNIRIFPWNYPPYTKLIRKHFGILAYLATIGHILWSYFLPTRFKEIPTLMSDWMGVIAFLWLTPLFLTSNRHSIAKLQSKWKKLHITVHVLIWFIFAHVMIKGISVASLIIFLFLLVDIFSWIQKSGLLEEVFGSIEDNAGNNRRKPEK